MTEGLRGRLRVKHVKPKPFALQAPFLDGRPVHAGLLRRQGSGNQVVDPAKHVCAVARAHQGFSCWRGLSRMKTTAAFGQASAAAAGAGLCHQITTSICRSFAGWPRILH